ncbi:type II and III secretion system protein family protein [Caulobacter sp. RL271]|jgi:pilus assembly protein CpaC|uniref:Type II and III secretion system protein family protein n=1 Tax=Caulobacter segnis TaxID=88688 RepID=A0ABY4ZQG7_9CAUL|nr:type II and III secretion system protein family protein [Caulobacter segnis]USQ94968.1 type II and III secretion system protein family protein [Caulobacter segnis]
MSAKRGFATAAVLALALAWAAPALADGPVSGSHVYRPAARVARPAPARVATTAPADQVTRVTLTADQNAASIELAKGKSAIIELPTDVRDLLVTNPVVADAVLRDKRRIYVVGLAEGVTDAAFFDAAGRRIVSLNIRVTQPVDQLAETLNQVLPDAKLSVRPIRDSVVLTGAVRSAAESEMASRIAARFVGGEDKVLNMISIGGKDQVTLQVRIVEVQRNVIKQLGISTSNLLNDGAKSYSLSRVNTYGVNNTLLGGGGACYGRDTIRATNHTSNASASNQTGSTASNGASVSNVVSGTTVDANGVTTTNSNNASTSSGVSSALSTVLSSAASTAWQTVTGNDLNACLQAFERVGLVRTLAEPNLTAVSGEAGHFLVGGEFPVPTGSDSTGKVTIEFKPYGVGLGYTPLVMSGGRISLKISTEVSELSSLGAFTLAAGGSGNATTTLTVPGLSVRRAETTVEMPSGGSFMIAGLLHQTTKQTVDSLPGMTSLPILGSLFRSRDYLDGQTELVIIVTPYIVDPTKPRNLQTPADGLDIASDMSTVLLGRLNKVVKAPAGANAGRAYQGPVGYVIE